jgi:hypothetical protein
MKASNDFSFEVKNCNRVNGTKSCFLATLTFIDAHDEETKGFFSVKFLDKRKKLEDFLKFI